MRRPIDTGDEVSGQDSFLDVVANIVGILIILVMVVGVRAGKAAIEQPQSEAEPEVAESPDTSALKTNVAAMASDARRIRDEAIRVAQEIAAARRERQTIVTGMTAVEQEIERRRAEMSEERRKHYDIRRDLAVAREQLSRLDQELIASQAVESPKVEIENLPTPLAKTVQGEERHFQLKHGLIAPIPLERLLTEFHNDAEQKTWRLNTQNRMVDIVGPIGGFRLRYELGKFDISTEVAMQTGRGGSIIQLIRWELLPTSDRLGEAIDVALRPDSEFRKALSNVNPRATSVTVWTYPDSFDEYRQVKKELHELGFPTAARPLPAGIAIGGSPKGSRSAAQ